MDQLWKQLNKTKPHKNKTKVVTTLWIMLMLLSVGDIDFIPKVEAQTTTPSAQTLLAPTTMDVSQIQGSGIVTSWQMYWTDNTSANKQNANNAGNNSTNANNTTRIVQTQPSIIQYIQNITEKKETSKIGDTIATSNIENDAVLLGEKTTGEYQKSTTAGNGISVDGTIAEGWTPTIGLGNLSSDWIQGGNYDIVLNSSQSNIKFLGTDGTYYATLVSGNLTSDATYTLSGASGTILTSANYNSVIATTVDVDALIPENNLSDLDNIATAKANLGLGSLANQNSNNVTITGGSITGINDLAVSDGGTGISSLPAAGRLLIGNGTGYTLAPLTSGSGIGITNGAGSITITNNGVTLLNGLTGTLSIIGSGINAVTTSPGNITVTGTEADTLNSVTGRGASTTNILSLLSTSNIINAGTLNATSGSLNGIAIGATNPATGKFTSVNANSINTTDLSTTNLSSSNATITGGTITGISALGVSEGGTGIGTTPTNGRLLIGNGSGYTLANLTAGSGISVSNGSGSITLTNSGVTALNSITGNISIQGSGNVSISTSPGTITVTGTEADTLATVAGRGATTSTSLTLSSSSNNITAGIFNATSGSINGIIIGATNPATGYFTSLTTSNANITGGSISGISPIGISEGGTGIGTTPTNGKILIGNGSGYTLANITAGSGINVTNGSGSITLTNSGVTALNSMTGNISIQGSGDISVTTGPGSITISGSAVAEADTLNSVTSRGATTSNVLSLLSTSNIINAGTLNATSGSINGIAIGATNPATGNFTTLTSSNVNITGGSITGITDLAISDGGTGISSSPALGKLLIGNGTGYTLANITAGSGVNISNGAGSITITNSGVTALNSQTGAISLAGAGINNIDTTDGLVTITALEVDTLATVTGRGATTSTALTLSNSSNDITVGTLTATGGSINNTIIGNSTPSSGVFTSINGLTITNNGSNTLNIASGKSLVVNNSLTLSGTDGTTLTLPAITNTLVGRTTTDTLTNKTIDAGNNTITGLTNSNLSGNAGITNANLANSSATITAGTGLAGGGLVSLGGTISLTNSGVLSLTGTSNQVNVSGSTGNVTLSLPQNISASASPSFATLTITNSSNQLVLGATNPGTLTWPTTGTRTLTLPDATDTLVGKATTDTLTNKTLTSPTINGTVATTGLTLPAFTASGTITGSSSPTISSFGAINGISLSSTLIRPSSSGALTLNSNGANTLTMDTGGSANLSIGITNASSITIGRTGVTTTLNGTLALSNLIIGGGTTITKHLSATNTFDAAAVSAGTCAILGTVTVTGAAVGDTAIATPTPTSGGVETLLLTWHAYVSSTDTVSIRSCTIATLTAQNPGSQTWRADVWQH